MENQSDISLSNVNNIPDYIIQYPNPILLQKSEDIKTITPEIISVGEKMLQAFIDCPICGGLAAVQIGIPIRLIMVKNGVDIIVLANPEITKTSKKTHQVQEQCLSIDKADSYYVLTRYNFVTVTGFNMMEMRNRTYKAHDDLAVSFQHEIDHLDGILINVEDEKSKLSSIHKNAEDFMKTCESCSHNGENCLELGNKCPDEQNTENQKSN